VSRREFLVFEVASAKFAIPLNLVEEVVPAGQITALPQSPHFLLGLSAVRGKVMGVVDAARRFSIGPSLNSHFIVCRVRGNLTAVAIDRPVVAGSLAVRAMDAAFSENMGRQAQVDASFLIGAFELLDEVEGIEIDTGVHFLEVDPDLFISAELAANVGEG
jgi:purine-binding chemotaxis protein CheW